MDYAESGEQVDYVHSVEIRWTKPTQPRDPMDHEHKAWRSDGLSTHGLEIRWTKHTRPGDQMYYTHRA